MPLAKILQPQVVSIAKGTKEYGPVAVPAQITAVTVTMSRENCPAAGFNIELLVSFDGGLTYLSPGPTHVDPFVPDTKHPNVLDYPAQIGTGWDQNVRQATHCKARTINTSGSAFQSTVDIDALVVTQLV